jgi:hypothetical protein
MGNAGRDGIYFQRELDSAIERRDLQRIYAFVPTVTRLDLARKVRILDVVLEQKPAVYDRAAGKFILDYAIERTPGLSGYGDLVDWLDPVMLAVGPLLELTDPRRRAT